jgi:hypothetical protein
MLFPTNVYPYIPYSKYMMLDKTKIVLNLGLSSIKINSNFHSFVFPQPSLVLVIMQVRSGQNQNPFSSADGKE